MLLDKHYFTMRVFTLIKVTLVLFRHPAIYQQGECGQMEYRGIQKTLKKLCRGKATHLESCHQDFKV